MILLGVLGPTEAPVGLLRRAEVLEPHAPPDTLVAGRPTAAVLRGEYLAKILAKTCWHFFGFFGPNESGNQIYGTF